MPRMRINASRCAESLISNVPLKSESVKSNNISPSTEFFANVDTYFSNPCVRSHSPTSATVHFDAADSLLFAARRFGDDNLLPSGVATWLPLTSNVPVPQQISFW